MGVRAEHRTAARERRRRLLAVAVAIAVVAVAFALALPRIAGYGPVWNVLRRLTWPWILALCAASVANILTFAPPWMVTLPRLGFVKALSMTQASTAFSSVAPGGAPVGMAASFAVLRSWGFGGRQVGLAVTLTGIWNQLSVFAFPIVAVALLALEGSGFRPLALLAFAGVTVFVVIVVGTTALLARPRLAYRAGELAASFASWLNRVRHREPPAWGGEALLGFRTEALTLLRRRWLALTVATLVNQLTGYLVFDLSLRAVGITRGEVSVVESFAAWSVGRLLVSLPLTPGGIGLVELGLAGTLVGFGGRNAEVVAGVLVYRALSVIPTLVFGLVVAATWRLHATSASPRRS